MNVAGASARKEYERRRQRDRERRRRWYKWRLGLFVVSLVLFFVVVRAGVTAFIDNAGTAGVLAGVFTLTIALRLAIELWGPKQSTEAWRKGAEGEQLTAAALSKLPPEYVALHDLPIHGSLANIDHVVIGPTGVFTVETKNYASAVEVRWGSARSAGRSLERVVEQARGQAKVASATLGRPVRPIVCVQGAGVASGPLSKGVAGGVSFCSGRRLARVITAYPVELTPDEVRELSELAGKRF